MKIKKLVCENTAIFWCVPIEQEHSKFESNIFLCIEIKYAVFFQLSKMSMELLRFGIHFLKTTGFFLTCSSTQNVQF